MSNMKRGPSDDQYGDGSKRSRVNTSEARLLIPSKVAGSIIGKGGANIQKLRSENHAAVRIPDSPGPERVMSIEGNEETLLSVIGQSLPLMAEDVARRSRGNTNTGDSQLEIRILIHQSLVGGIIGKGGSKIKEIREASGANLKAYQTTCPHSTERCVAIKGSVDSILLALKEVFSITLNGETRGPNNPYDPANYDGFFSQEYGGYGSEIDGSGNMFPGRGGMGGPPPPNMGGFPGFRGPGGRGQFPPGGFQGGAAASFGGGENFSKPFGGDLGMDVGDKESTQVTIPKDVAGAIIGPGGNRIRRIRAESHCNISIGDVDQSSNERIITIEGTTKQIQMAQYLLQQSVREHGIGGVPGPRGGSGPRGGPGGMGGHRGRF